MLNEIQKVEYCILKELDRVCKKHDIIYFLGQGTLLGAAKYKGFIPWDDDIDLLVPYDGLDRLMDVFPKEQAGNYFITNHTVEEHYPLSWTKIRAKGTLSRPVRYKRLPIDWGICVDLFPIYPLSDAKLVRKLEIVLFKAANKAIMAELTKYDGRGGAFKRVFEKMPLKMRHSFLDFAVSILKRHKGETKYVLLPCKGVKIVRRELIFGKKRTLPFEDGIYPVPADYHAYLTLNFGDYLAPLPPELQKGHESRLGEIEWRI